MSLLFDQQGHRKYLTRQERAAFLKAALNASPEVETFCSVLAYTGARISEVLALTPSRIDFEASVIIFETLKKRRKGVYRAVPVPKELLARLNEIHDLRTLTEAETVKGKRIWPWGRTAAWRYVKDVMQAAKVSGPQASPKGLRHAFGVLTLQFGVPLNLVSRWLGHSRLSTTAIYADAVGEEERSLAAQFWKSF